MGRVRHGYLYHRPQFEGFVEADAVQFSNRTKDRGCPRAAHSRVTLRAAAREATAAAAAPTGAVSSDGATDYPFGSALLVPVAVQSGSLIVTLALALRHTFTCVHPSQKLITYAVAIGLLDVMGDLALTYAIAVGPVSMVGPLGSLDPMVAVLLASVLFKEPMTVRRLVGLGACAVGIALVAV